MFNCIEIQYADPRNLDNSYSVKFDIKLHSVAQKWAGAVSVAVKKHTLDDPGRFYGFGSKQSQIQRAISRINQPVDTINNFEPIVDRRLENIDDQDTLNYLHHIFEVYHGLLDQQTNEFWSRSPAEVHRALADLNILVHECEAVNRSIDNRPSHISTWYQMPKIMTLTDDEYSLFEPQARKGTIYLLYTEIGKTLEDLSIDHDNYIHDTAFKPFRYFSADFIVKYYDDDINEINQRLTRMEKFYKNYEEFFIRLGLPWGHPYLSAGLIPVATLNMPDDLVVKLETRQWVRSIHIT